MRAWRSASTSSSCRRPLKYFHERQSKTRAKRRQYRKAQTDTERASKTVCTPGSLAERASPKITGSETKAMTHEPQYGYQTGDSASARAASSAPNTKTQK